MQGVIGTPTDATILEPVAKARDCLERLTRIEPRNAAAWAALVLVFNNQRTWGFPSPTGEVASVETRLYLADMAVEAANRALEIAPNDAFVRGLVARAAWMACQPDLLRLETMRAIEFNRTIRKISGRSAISWPMRVSGTRASRSPKRASP